VLGDNGLLAENLHAIEYNTLSRSDQVA
jgi:hypothetical protein